MAKGTPTSQELFDSDFLESLKRLHIVARRVARGGRHAEQRSHDLSSGIEFRDFKSYTAGDDFRAIDWNIYQRLGRVFLRLFEELEDLPVYLLPDISRSMYFEDPPRAFVGLRTSLALASIALGQHDTVGLFPFSNDLDVALRPGSGKQRLHRLAQVMGDLEPGGETDFAHSIHRFGALGLRQGLVIVVSDFFDPAGVEVIERSLRSLRHRVLLVQLCRRSDAEPEHQGDFEFFDCENGQAENVSATASVVASYRRIYSEFVDGLVGAARRLDAGFLSLDVERDVVAQLAVLFERGTFRT